MNHIIICPEYPPAPIPPGGIGTYVFHISQLLAESGETVHVIAQLWEGAPKKVEEKCHGRLIIYRVPLDDWDSFLVRNPIPQTRSREVKALFKSSYPAQCFSWQAGLLAESLAEQEGVDLIEAQEYDAPLYYLQLRRALGFGPKKRPPCVVHLHSPVELIVRYNDGDIGHPRFLTQKRLEDYSIAAADALLCPSRYLAYQLEAHFGLADGFIKVIPYPIGDTPLLKRDKDTWENGTICYVGRLERRKGVIEWVEAAVNVAGEYPSVRFEFVGTNCLGTNKMTGEEFIERLIPKDLRVRFLFRGEQKRSSLPQFLTGARIAVVPSRWENFPNTCIEAMCSGLPVIASPSGGMAEMIRDGQTGWLASDQRSEGLAEALKRALETPSAKIEEMGFSASSDIRRLCDNNKIVERHLDFRRQVANQGVNRSSHLPANLPWAKRPLSEESTHTASKKSSEKGLAIVVTCVNNGQHLDQCLQSIKRQSHKPVAVIVVDDASTEKQKAKALNQAQWEGWIVIHSRNGGHISGKNAGIEAVLGSGLDPLGFVFLDSEDRLKPEFIEACESVLQRCSGVGLVSCWVHDSENDNKVWIRPCPSFPYQWLSNDAAPFSAIRTEALLEAGNFRHVMSQGHEDWDIFNAVMAAGWIAVTIPETLGSHRFREDSILNIINNNGFSRMRQELLERFPDLIARDAKDIVLLTESNAAQLMREEFFSLQEQLAKAQMMLRRPGETALRVLTKMKKKIFPHPL